jgi:organic radical activating enzyme
MVAIFPDVITRVKDFAQLGEGQLVVSNTFLTIQGEGPLAGSPAFFIRLAGCNRGAKTGGPQCDFCDADFRLSKSNISDINRLETLAKNSLAELVVITGGEPFLQPNLDLLCFRLLDAGKSVQIESNGDFWFKPKTFTVEDGMEVEVPQYFINHENFTLVVSPKVNRKGEYKLPKHWKHIDALKFVVSADKKSPYHNLPSWLEDTWELDYPQKIYVRDICRIYVSPMAVYKRELIPGEIANIWDHTLVDVDQTRANYHYAAQLAIQKDYLLNTQSHLMIGME